MGVILQEQWTAKSSAVKGLADIYNIKDADPEDIASIQALMIRTSFFLPREILTLPGVEVSQLAILPQYYFQEFWYTSTSLEAEQVKYCYWSTDTDMKLLLQAKHVGVSARWWCNNLYLVGKVWYGMPATETTAAFNARFNKLLKFCKLPGVKA